ncbi:hypothetical protein Vafri_14608 [Volvox africanus]|uniref:tRNA (uracil(54)-C(5))-methyltransferase n=1 Tax=Volvox africanus TaxID=51714 RepID=A0A8J4BEG7_9CHLO|nr:hypothetical protein Vafri_14608 [Volvox africanus]
MQLHRRVISSAAGQVRAVDLLSPAPVKTCNFQSRKRFEIMASVIAPLPEETATSPSFVAPIAVTSVDESQYKTQLQEKIKKLKELFCEFNPPELEVFESPPSHYRMRAEFTIDQRNGELQYIMFDNSPLPSPPPSSSSPTLMYPSGPGGANEDAEGGDAAASTSAAATTAAATRGVGVGGGRPKGPRRVVVEHFPVASRQLNELMEVVRRECGQSPELRNRLFQANFHTTLSGDAMVTLLYHRKLGPEWAAAAEHLRDALAATPSAAAAGRRPHVIGRSRKQKLELDAGFVLERLRVGGREYIQKQAEGAFSQPNAAVCQHMLSWALDVTRTKPGAQRRFGGEGGDGNGSMPLGAPTAAPAAAAAAAAALELGGNGGGPDAGEAETTEGDMLELYCGNGNFTVPLAQNFRRVVATEVSKSSVEAARFNLEANSVTNVFLARMASEEFAETMRTRGSRRRLEGLGPWEELRLRTILVDPPRAGLDDFTVGLLKEFDRIVYISCNPETLHANLRAIADTHGIARFAAFDQFPYTHHLECGVYLVRR